MDHWTFHTIMIKSLHGRIGDTVYVFRKGKQHTRPYVIPRNPDTPAQRARRSVFADAVRAWKELSVEEKEGLNKEACRMKRSGYNLFIGRYMRTAAQRPVPIIVRHKTARVMVRPMHKACRTIQPAHRPIERRAYRTGIANRASPEYTAA